MTEEFQDTPDTADAQAPSPTTIRSLRDVLSILVGKVVTVVNPESYKKTPIGFTIDKETYRAKLKALHEDCVEFRTEFVIDPRKGTKEITAQFVPFEQIKRVTIRKGEEPSYIHL